MKNADFVNTKNEVVKTISWELPDEILYEWMNFQSHSHRK